MAYKDPEKKKAADRRYREKNRKEIQRRYQQWCQEHPDKIEQYRKRHATKEVARVVRWQKDNPDKTVAKLNRRRARKIDAPQGDPAEAAAYEQILREGICEICGSRAPVAVDHIEALSTGGEHGWENFAGLCQSCNSSKRDKPLLAHLLAQTS